MELVLAQADGERAGGVEVPDAAFAVPFNEALVHQVVTAYLAGARAGTRAQKTRAEVRGGGAKPWRQKGTGRARVGSIRSPLWRGGGVTFAGKPRSHAQKVNRKAYRAAMRSIVSELVRQDRLVIVEALALPAAKTRELVGQLAQLGLGLDNVLIITEGGDQALELAARNMHRVAVLEAARVDPVSLIAYEKVLITVPALKRLEERLT